MHHRSVNPQSSVYMPVIPSFRSLLPVYYLFYFYSQTSSSNSPPGEDVFEYLGFGYGSNFLFAICFWACFPFSQLILIAGQPYQGSIIKLRSIFQQNRELKNG